MPCTVPVPASARAGEKELRLVAAAPEDPAPVPAAGLVAAAPPLSRLDVAAGDGGGTIGHAGKPAGAACTKWT
ncbi:MAG: hypothetical protein ACRD2Z_07350 [Thermoanaerobaculia bacterium]